MANSSVGDPCFNNSLLQCGETSINIPRVISGSLFNTQLCFLHSQKVSLASSPSACRRGPGPRYSPAWTSARRGPVVGTQCPADRSGVGHRIAGRFEVIHCQHEKECTQTLGLVVSLLFLEIWQKSLVQQDRVHHPLPFLSASHCTTLFT